MPRLCTDCFHCKVKVILNNSLSWGRKPKPSQVIIMGNSRLTALLNLRIMFGGVRCAKGLWRMTNMREFRYKNFNHPIFEEDSVKNSSRLHTAERCGEYEDAM